MLHPSIQSPVPTGPSKAQLLITPAARRERLSRSAEAALAIRVARGDEEAQRTLIEANRPLVVAIARQHRGCGLELDDLIQEGTIGLMRGIERFDHRRGCRLSTYASWWVRQAIRQAVANCGRAIRLPGSAIAELRRIEASRGRIAAELGREPGAGELASATGIPADRIAKLCSVARRPLSLDQPPPGADRPLRDLLPDPGAKAVAERHDELARSVASAALSALSDSRQRRILELHYGLGARESQSVRGIGAVLGVSGARVSQLETAALDYLRERPAAPRWHDVLVA